MNAMLMNLGLVPIPPIPKVKVERVKRAPLTRAEICHRARNVSLKNRSAKTEQNFTKVLEFCSSPRLLDEIADHICVSRSGSQKIIKKLLASGLIKRERRDTPEYKTQQSVRIPRKIYFYEAVKCRA